MTFVSDNFTVYSLALTFWTTKINLLYDYLLNLQNSLPQIKILMVLTCVNNNPELLGKFVANSGRLGNTWWPKPPFCVSHTSAAQWVVGYKVWPDWLCLEKEDK